MTGSVYIDGGISQDSSSSGKYTPSISINRTPVDTSFTRAVQSMPELEFEPIHEKTEASLA